MDVFRSLPADTQRQPCGLTIGNFDGVHLGHQAMLAHLKELCRAAGLPMTVLTFDPHPKEYFAALRATNAPARISGERDKLDALAAAGVQRVVILPFDEQLALTPATAFIDDILVDGMAMRELIIGDDFRFGAKRAGDFDLLAARQGKRYRLSRMPTVNDARGQRVSSSLVRAALADGDFAAVRALLGRAYVISGSIVHGRKLGRTLGYPTLNVPVPSSRPALSGVFVTRVHGLAEHPLPAVASLGTRPAVETNGEPLLEVHVFDFSDDVYGKAVRVEFLHKLRDERGFNDLQALRAQIDADANAARAFFASHQEPDGQG